MIGFQCQKPLFFTIYNLSGTANSVSECSQGTVQQCSPEGVQRVSEVKYFTKNPFVINNMMLLSRRTWCSKKELKSVILKTSKENKHGHPHQDWSSQTPAVLTLVELKICSKLFVQWWSNSSVQKIMLFRHLESKIKPWSSNELGMQWKRINTLQYLRLIHFQGETGIANIKVSSAHKCKSLVHTNLKV